MGSTPILVTMITPIVIKIHNTKRDVVVTYIKKDNSFYKKEIRDRQHKLRIKEVIYGGVFNYYNESMDFTYSIQEGGKILIDNR